MTNYGIWNENSDQRAHVGPRSKCIYVFKTLDAKRLLKERASSLELTPAGQPGVNGYTGKGFCVPIEWFGDDLFTIPFPNWLWWNDFKPDLPTSKKGQLAVRTVCKLVEMRKFPLFPSPKISREDDRLSVQIKGQYSHSG